jgi:hypothetical protein
MYHYFVLQKIEVHNKTEIVSQLKQEKIVIVIVAIVRG